MSLFKNIELETVLDINEIVPYGDNTINSSMLALKNNLNATIFAFDENEMISEHTAPADALVYIFDGELDISINKINHTVKTGEMILMPATIPHSLKAIKKSKMLLLIVKKNQNINGFINLEYSINKPFTSCIKGFKNGVVSKRIINNSEVSSLLFSISKDEAIEHNQVTGETFILVLEGELNIITNDNSFDIIKNNIFIVPSNTLYELKSNTDSVFLLIELN